MKIKMIRGCIGGGKRLDEGKVYESPKDLPEKDAAYLVVSKSAEEVEGKKEPAKGVSTKSGLTG
jgi:hypothetical protein